MLRFPCLVLDHDDTVVRSEATVNYPCFCRFLKQHRPGASLTLAEYVSGCNEMAFVDFCRTRFSFTEEELALEYSFWKAYAATHLPLPFPGIAQLLHTYRRAGGIICVVSMSAQETILRDYRTHFGFEPDRIYGWDLPPEHRKPSPYALERIQAEFSLEPEQILVVDDMKAAVPMARAAGCPIAFAGWGRLEYPGIFEEMSRLCDTTFRSPQELEAFILNERDFPSKPLTDMV